MTKTITCIDCPNIIDPETAAAAPNGYFCEACREAREEATQPLDPVPNVYDLENWRVDILKTLRGINKETAAKFIERYNDMGVGAASVEEGLIAKDQLLIRMQRSITRYELSVEQKAS